MLTTIIPLKAQPAPLTATDALEKFSFESFNKKLDRGRLARLVTDYCSAVLHILPRNSPREDAWVDEEIKSGVWDRIQRAITSVENARKSLVDNFSECVLQGRQLTKLPIPSSATEAVLWIRIAGTFGALTNTDNAERLRLLHYDRQLGWVDSHRLKTLPLLMVSQAHHAAIEALGHRP